MKQAVSGNGIPAAIGPYSPAVVLGTTVYCSGQLGLDPATGNLVEGVAAQAEQAMVNLGTRYLFWHRSHNAIVGEKEAVERELGDNGRVLIRPSGTEPLVRVMVEARSAELAESMAKRIAARFEV